MENGSQISVTVGVANKLAVYRINGMHFPVRILDARKVYGRMDALITPVGGTGEVWVDVKGLTITD
jgi:hypothetical protein